MRQTIYLLTAALCVCGTYSCRQYLNHPIHGHGDNTISINLIYPNPDTTDYGNTFELIISEPYGNVLLDTIAPYNVPIVAKVKTTKPLLDFSTVIYSPTFNFYDLTITKSVQPDQWTTLGAPPLTYPAGVP